MIEIIWYLSFSVWLILLRIMHSRSIHAIANGKISFLFNGWVVFHCLYICISHLLYPFIYWWVASISWLLWIMLQWTRRHICCCRSVAKSCPTLCEPMDCSTPGLPVLHYLPEFVQTHVHWVDDAFQPSHPLSPFLLLASIVPNIRVF